MTEEEPMAVRSRVRIVLISVGLLCGTSGIAAAQAQEGEQDLPAVSLRETAVTLARSGVAHQDARLVLGAALLTITAEGATPGIELVKGDLWAPVGERESLRDFSAAALLRLASRIAVDQGDAVVARAAAELTGRPALPLVDTVPPVLGVRDTALAAVLHRAAAALVSVRGAVGGPIWKDGFVQEGGEAEYRVSFEGSYLPNAIVILPSHREAQLECSLYEGDRLDQSVRSTDGRCTLRWKQRHQGQVTLRIRNEGTGTYYTLTSN
jgi:hypothetical protein